MAHLKTILILCLICNTIMANKTDSLSYLLPDSVEGWESQEEDRQFNPDNLFDYINGGAELYLSYGFNEVLNRTYLKSGHPEIRVDVFDMVDSHNAFGVFCHVRETVEKRFGQGSQQYEGAIIFWRNNYYISIMSHDETEDSRIAMEKIATEIDARIESTGSLPEVIDRLPTKGLSEESVIYFHHPIWVNALYYTVDENIFNVNLDTQCVTARYGELGDRQYVLMIQYPDSDHASIAFENFQNHFSKEDIFQIEDGKWCSGNLKGTLLYCVFDASTKEKAQNLIDLIQNHNKDDF